jgi:zinc protease
MSAVRPKKIGAPGGTVAFLVESHELPLVDISISFRTGSVLDPASSLGLSRAMARMLRRGSASWNGDQIEESIDRLGGEISLDVAPSTITVQLQVIRRNLAPFLSLVTDMLARPTFPEDELARLRRETVAEIIEARDHDSSLARRFFRKALFGEHPYGRGSSGTTTSVPTITRDQVVASHATHFRQGNVVLGVAGDVTEDDVRKIILPVVAALPDGVAPADPSTDPTVPEGRRLFFVDKPARTQTQILIGGLGTHACDPDHVALHVANTVFGGTFTARLMREVRSKRGWSYGAYSRMPIDRRRESFSMWTFPASTDAVACIALEFELLEALIKDGITEQELAFARNYLCESYAFDIDTPFKRVRQAVDEDIFGLPDDYHTAYVPHVRAVTLDEANSALRTRISLDDLTVAVVGTASELEDAVAQAIPRIASRAVVPFDSE